MLILTQTNLKKRNLNESKIKNLNFKSNLNLKLFLFY